jgi:putative ABC transport system substrate-binding protein
MTRSGHARSKNSAAQIDLWTPISLVGISWFYPLHYQPYSAWSHSGKVMRRRNFIKGFIGAGIAWPLVARARPSERMRRIGFLSSYTDEGGKALIRCFRRGLEQAGWVEGRTISIEYRWAEGRAEQYSALATELTRLNLDVIACNSTPAAQALQRATRDVPIVFMTVSAPVESGIISSLARPQGNITGVSNYSPATAGKLLELLKTARPDIAHVIVLRDPANNGKMIDVRELQANAPKLGLMLQVIGVRNGKDIEHAFSAVGRPGEVGIVTLTDGVTLSNREQIVELAKRHRLPTIFQTKEFVAAGGLMSYGINFCQHFKRAAAYVDKILKGAKPADLPVELPTTFEFVINLKAAKGIGLTFPPTMLTLADQVIE